MKLSLTMLFAVVVLATPSPISALLCRAEQGSGTADELVGAAKVHGGEVEVQVRHKDGRPAAGVQIRLVYARQLTTAAASTDAQGRWVHTVTRPGPYEAIIESETENEQNLRLPFIVMDREELGGTAAVPWVRLLVGLVCIIAAAGILVPTLCVGTRKVSARKAASGILFAAGMGCLIWSAWLYWLKPGPPAVPAGPDVANSARDFLRSRDVKPLSAPLERLLADSGTSRVKTQPHPLLGKAAPDFVLSDHQQKPWRLSERLQQGPVVLVFYYGYHCNHCVGQLFALHDDMAKFRELGGQVLAVSADPPEWTRARFKQYGEFAFPVLSDPGNKIAQAYEMFQPATPPTPPLPRGGSGGVPENLQHGTFVIGRDGIVHWTQYGYEPFTGNPTLLYELAALEGRLPARQEKK